MKRNKSNLLTLIESKMSSLKLNNEGVLAISGFTGDKTEELLGMIANKMLESDELGKFFNSFD